MKKSLLALIAFSIATLSHAATATDPRGLTRRIAPQTSRRTVTPPAAPTPAAPAPAPAAVQPAPVPLVRVEPPIDPAKAEAAKKDTEDKRLAFQRKKAEAGADYAQDHLGIRYLNGDGVEKNVDTGKEWLEKAAKNGNSNARKKLDELKGASK